ncbi:putative mitochondrial protein, partial [Mucuna pruriens]
MLDKGSSNTGSVMVTRKGFTKRSTSKGKPFTKSSRGEYYMYCKQPGHTKDTYYKLYGKENVFERMGGNKDPTQMWVNKTTFDKVNVVEHPSTLQLDQDIQAFSKEEMDRLRALLNSTNKPLGSCGLTMNGKSSFNISGSVPQNIWILDSRATDHMTLFPSDFTSYLKVPKRQLITIANGDHVPIARSINVQLHSCLSLHNELTTRRMIGVAKVHGGLYYLQYTKIGNNINKEELPSSQQATLETWAASQIQLYHKRLGHPPFGLRSDNGTEFVNLEFSKFLKDNGVVHELTCMNTPQQNGIVERKNHHLLEVDKALLFQMSIPNDVQAQVQEVTPTQDVQVQVQEITPTQDVQVQEVTKPTLVPEQVQMSELNVSIPDNSIEEQVQLFELEVSILDNSIEDVIDYLSIALRKGIRSCVKYPISQFVRIDHLFVQHQSFTIAIDAIKAPTSVQEALKDENWVQAMKEEMEALEKNSTWEIVDRPKDKRVVGYRWIYTVKCKSDGTLE